MAQMVKNLPAMRETWVQSLDWEDSLEEGMATHPSIFPGESPWTEEPGSPGGRKESDMTEYSTAHNFLITFSISSVDTDLFI